jgi:hypothetical protein
MHITPAGIEIAAALALILAPLAGLLAGAAYVADHLPERVLVALENQQRRDAQ